MIHHKISRGPDGQLAELHISVTAESLANFQELVNRSLNCWDTAPKELKDLGDMMTHGYVTQDHTYKKMGAAYTGADRHSMLYPPDEPLPICEHCMQKGYGHLYNCPVLLGDKDIEIAQKRGE
jgi:hypothetical protein